MRAQIFKIAGVKNDKEFYKLFPDEASFMKKHGKAFKKAQSGFMDKMGGVAGIASTAGDIAGGISGLLAERKQVKGTEQTMKVADINAQAMAFRPELEQNQYVRPEDIQNTGEEFFPIYGVGTNVLAQDGKILKRGKLTSKDGGNMYMGQNGLMDWFGKSAIGEQTDADGNITQVGMNNAGVASELGGKVAGMLGEKPNAGGQLGKGIGSGVGKLIPIPGASQVLGFVGERLGNALDPHAKKIASNQAATERSMQQMTGMGIGRQIQQGRSANVQDGGTFPQGEKQLSNELQTHWGGDAETISYNPFLPGGGETIQFNGDAHNGSNIKGQSGIGVSFNSAQDGASNEATLEVEGGEAATKLEGENGEENVVVFGNLPITKSTSEMLGDKLAAGKKVKNYVKGISKNEETSNKALKKNSEELAELDIRTSYDKLKAKGLEAMDIGHKMRLKIAADKKKNVAAFQKSITDTAEEHGIVANDLARGKYKVDKGAFTPSNQTAQYGAEVPVAQDGELSDKEKLAKLEAERQAKIDAGLTEKKWFEGTEDTQKNTLGVPGGGEKDTYDGSGGYETTEKWNAWLKTPKGKAYSAKYGKKRDGVSPMKVNVAGMDDMYNYEKDSGLNSMPNRNFSPEGEAEKANKFGIGDAMGIANGILPYVRPSDADNLDYNQLMGEMYALSHNKVEPVNAQKFTPRLDVPYDISLQDQRNDVTSATRAASRFAGGNPAAQAMIAQQSYDPLNKINAEEFRQNQAMKHQVYSGNRATLNDANFKNLQILDQQGVRQSQARSNTKEATQLALNSVADKYAKHALENKTLGIYENMYNYRFGANNIAQNMNPLAQFNMNGSPGSQGGSLGDQILKGEEQIKAMKQAYKDQRNTQWAPPGTNAQDGKAIKKIPLVRALKGYN